MNETQDQPPVSPYIEPKPAVCGEDIRRAAEVISNHRIDQARTDRHADRCTCGAEVADWEMHWAECLVSHGWGPRPSVDANVVCEDIDCCGRNTVIIRLRECGIEVTDGE